MSRCRANISTIWVAVSVLTPCKLTDRIDICADLGIADAETITCPIQCCFDLAERIPAILRRLPRL